jgi:hypothetical protein
MKRSAWGIGHAVLRFFLPDDGKSERTIKFKPGLWTSEKINVRSYLP